MTLRWVVVVSVLVLTGCAASERQIPVGAVVVSDTEGGQGPDVYSVCDGQGNLLYLNKKKGGPVVAIKDGCVKTKPDVPVPVAAPPQPVILQWPSQPVQIQIVGPPEPKAAVTPEAPREPIVIQILPAPGTEAVQVPMPSSAPKAAPKAAPKLPPPPCVAVPCK